MAGDADKPRKTNRSKWNILIVCHIVFSIVLAALVIHNYVKNESRFKELGEKLERCETIRDLASEMTVSVSTSTPRVVQDLSAMLRRSPQENETSEISRTTIKTKIKAGFIEAQEENTTEVGHEGFLPETGPGIQANHMQNNITAVNESSPEKHFKGSDGNLSRGWYKGSEVDPRSCLELLKSILVNESQKICTDLRGPRGPPGSRGPRGFTGTPGEQGKPGGSHAVGGQQGEGCSGTMLAPPLFLETQPTYISREGISIKMTCNTTANPSANIMWFRNDVILTGRRYQISQSVMESQIPRRIQMLCPSKVPHPITQSTLVIKETRGSDTGTYTCRARNMMGARDYHVDLIVQVAPRLTSLHKTPLTIVENSTAVVPCTSTGFPTPEISWSKIGNSMDVSRMSYDSQALIIKDVRYSDRGTYVCSATNEEGRVNGTVTVIVQVAPRVHQQPKAIEFGYRPASKELQLRVFGFPPPNITWSGPALRHSKSRVNQSDGSLMIMRTEFRDSGEYQAIVKNVVGQAVIRTFLVVNQGVAPLLMSFPTTPLTIVENSTAVVPCISTGFPAPVINWTKIENSMDPSRMSYDSRALTIKDVRLSDVGTYVCSATNVAGQVNGNVTVIVKGVQIKLSHGSYGRVEVFHNGQWGTVCDDNWTIKEGRVVCRWLGYRSVVSVHTGAHHGQGSGPIWLDDVHCSGNEATLFSCRFSNKHNCSHGEDASVQCN
ncbi:hemicentin-1 isoform X3 [Nematostella vectensis]|uniref:hemicentin-1 isoform X3 n=1 Tax=Nematostella vectensis TaxID=45351 RepID=UPI0020773C2F|nr:hemicentin-1 isoform X3 [Nematostella vectensis]